MPDHAPNSDEYYMARALQLAWRGRFTTHPNPNVGCVLVRDGRIVGEGFHARAGEMHAEIHALRMAAEQARGATAYVTLEPCSHYGRTPPCCEALIAAGVARVVVALTDPNPQVAGSGLERLRQAGIAVTCGLMAHAAEAQNPGFLHRMRHNRPWLQLKLAASLDGRTAMASGESQWITSAQARQDVQRARAMSGAILSTSATVLADDPALTVRWQALDSDSQQDYLYALAHYASPPNSPPSCASDQPQSAIRQPVRIILDRQQQLPPAQRLLHQPGQSWLIHGADSPPCAEQAWPDNVRHIYIPEQRQRLDLTALMAELARAQINSLWVEAGARLAGALIQAQLVDELLLYIAPKLLGHHARALCLLPGLERLAQAPDFAIQHIRQIGPDICLHLRPTPHI